MLNRTNRTLSAKTNRLNLGTRSLVLVASGIDGKSTLRTRPAHGFAMRGRMFGSPDPSIQPSAIGNSSDPGSSPAHPWPVAGPVERPPVVEPVTPSVPRARPSFVACLPDTDGGQSRTRPHQGRVERHRNTLQGQRLRYGKARGAYRVRADRAATAANAVVAWG